MSDYIKREDAIDAVLGWSMSAIQTNAMLRDMETIPAADVRPVVRGKCSEIPNSLDADSTTSRAAEGGNMKNIRGFEVQHFLDDYGMDCIIQESSSVEPHVWLGVHNPPHKIMWCSAEKYGIEIGEKAGWYDYPIPEEVLVESRMHLTRKQAKSVAKKLLYFAKHGVLKEEK